MVTLGTLKVPAVHVIPPFITQFTVLKADKSNVPAVSVTKPVKVDTVALLFSVKLPVPFTVVAPATLNEPAVEIKSEPETIKFCGILILPVPPKVVPPEPVKVTVPAPVKAIF